MIISLVKLSRSGILPKIKKVSGAQLIYNKLLDHNVKDVFLYSGGSIMPLIDKFSLEADCLCTILLANTTCPKFDLRSDAAKERTLVPTLFMQPFVENAIIHGLLPKNGDRKIQILIEQMDQGIRCVIEDNGIGRDASRELNKKRNRSHQSTALIAIENRIKILNASANTKIKMEIIDLQVENIPTGTRVILEVA